MEYSLNAGEWNKVFAVPSSVVDKYIKLASGNALKLLLYLMRHGGEAFSAETLRAELGFERLGELEDAALFWVQRGIIRADSGKNSVKLSAAEAKAAESLSDEGAQTAPAVVQPTNETEKRVPVNRNTQKAKPPALSSGEIAEEVKNSPEMKALFEAAENLFGRMLRGSDRETIAGLTGYYGLPCDVALMLLGYCTNLKEKHGKKITANYISSVAQNWSDEEIMTVQLAEEKIRSLEKQSSIEEKICQALGLTSKPTTETRNFIKRAVDWKFSEEMIMLAYDKTVDATGGWGASYANKIMENWYNAGITTPSAAEKADEEFKKANSFKKPYAPSKKSSKKPAEPENSSLDIDDFEAQLLKNYKK